MTKTMFDKEPSSPTAVIMQASAKLMDAINNIHYSLDLSSNSEPSMFASNTRSVAISMFERAYDEMRYAICQVYAFYNLSKFEPGTQEEKARVKEDCKESDRETLMMFNQYAASCPKLYGGMHFLKTMLVNGCTTMISAISEMDNDSFILGNIPNKVFNNFDVGYNEIKFVIRETRRYAGFTRKEALS